MTDDELNEFVPKVHFEQIPIKNLDSSQSYQRNLSIAHIQKAAENFDLYQINPVKVSRRDGKNYVFNGQHTIEIVALVSGSRDTPVWCMIYDDLNYTSEADIFANQQKFVKPLQAYEIFNANVEAGNNTQLLIKDLVESYNLHIAPKKQPGNICAVSTLESIYTKYGLNVLSKTLRLLIATWEGDCNSFSANMLNAVAKLIVTYGDLLDEEIFKERLGEVSIKQIIRTAKERKSGCLGYAEAMVLEYNGKKKNSMFKLSLSKLYSSSSNIYIPDENEEMLEMDIDNDKSEPNLLDQNTDTHESDEQNQGSSEQIEECPTF